MSEPTPTAEQESCEKMTDNTHSITSPEVQVKNTSAAVASSTGAGVTKSATPNTSEEAVPKMSTETAVEKSEEPVAKNSDDIELKVRKHLPSVYVTPPTEYSGSATDLITSAPSCDNLAPPVPPPRRSSKHFRRASTASRPPSPLNLAAVSPVSPFPVYQEPFPEQQPGCLNGRFCQGKWKIFWLLFAILVVVGAIVIALAVSDKLGPSYDNSQGRFAVSGGVKMAGGAMDLGSVVMVVGTMVVAYVGFAA